MLLRLRFVPDAWRLSRPLRFLYDDLVGGCVGCHEISGTPHRLLLPHGRPFITLELVHDVFGAKEYEPPEPLATALPDAPAILDVGANVGAFAAFAVERWPGSTITCVEPDPTNLAILRSMNALNHLNLSVIDAGASNRAGSTRFRSGLGSGSYVDSSGDDTVDLIDIFPLLMSSDFVKMDIEGSEWPILRDPRLRLLEDVCFVIEYHRKGAPELPARQAAIDLFTRANFTTGFGHDNYWGHGILWAWKYA